jgi:hypothetical protein
MNTSARLRATTAALAAALPALVQAQPAEAAAGPWQFTGTLYLWLPTLEGHNTVPVDTGGSTISIDAGKLLEHLDFVLMGSLEAHNGRWGAFTDLVYLKLTGSKAGSRDFTIGRIGLPASTSANFDATLKGGAWTIAGEYRLASGPGMNVDALGGLRVLDLKQQYTWNLSGDIGPIQPSGRSGSADIDTRVTDLVVGVKGRMPLGAPGKWSLLYYADVGAGDSKLTWQAAAGASYAFRWGEVLGMWRYLSYDLKSSSNLENFSFNGPLVGVSFRW